MNQGIISELPDGHCDSRRGLYLTFHLNEQNYGLPIDCVTEIVGIQEITTVPDMPACIKGIINLRGCIFPVMDVRIRFNLPVRNYDDRTCIIVIRVGDTTTGIIVDRVNEVVEIPAEQIEPAPHFQEGKNYLAGIGKVGDVVNVLLNAEALVDLDIDISTGDFHEQGCPEVQPL